jgi:hypothetical protein
MSLIFLRSVQYVASVTEARFLGRSNNVLNPLVPLRTLEYVHTMFFKMLITVLLVVLFLSSLLCPTAYCRGFIFLPPQRCYPPQSLHNS